MADFGEKRSIINRRDLIAALDDMRRDTPPADWSREVTIRIKAAHYWGFQEIRRRFLDEKFSGRQVSSALSYLMDQCIRILYDFAVEHQFPQANPTKEERICIVATGGYGRAELAPYSDIDLLFVLPYKSNAWTENVIEFILYALWDLGVKVGQAVRTTDDCVRQALADTVICTSTLDGRYLWGDRQLYTDVETAFRSKVVAVKGQAFITAKLEERDTRHARMGDSRYVVEPNLKDGKGGLRDLQTLWWIAHFLYGGEHPRDMVETGVLSASDYRQFKKAHDFLWTIRCAMHYLSGRAEERLGFDIQRETAQLLGYNERAGTSATERFMKHYFLIAKSVGDLTRIFLSILEDRQQKAPLFSRLRNRRRKIRNFLAEAGQLKLIDSDDFRHNPARMLALFHVADKEGLEIHPDTLLAVKRALPGITRKVRRDPVANADFMAVLTSRNSAEVTLRHMSESGVLGRFIPDFGRVVALMQFDMYHHYTVDEHSIRAVGLLAAMEAGRLDMDHSLATRNFAALASRDVLYIAVFLHDIAKGRGGDHSELGGEVALDLCPRLGFDAGETQLVAWLVRAHLFMSLTAFKRDLADPKTIEDFIAEVKSPERLRLLHILTIVDIRAVGPGRWNAWKGQLLDELYSLAEERLVAGHASSNRDQRVAAIHRSARSRMVGYTDDQIDHFLARMKEAYWLAEGDDVIDSNMQLISETDGCDDPIGIKSTVVEDQDMTRVSVYAPDERGLFSRIVGAISVAGGSIIEAKVHTTLDGYAVDNFILQTGEQFGAHGAAEAFDANSSGVGALIRKAFDGKLKPREQLDRPTPVRQQEDAFHIAPHVVVDNLGSTKWTIIEVNAKDRPGLLYALVRVLFRMKLSIASAHISTFGERAVDVFYVGEVSGEKIRSPLRLKNLRAKLLAAAEDTVASAPKTAGLERSA